MRTALIVTVTEGVELQPQAAFASSALRTLGFEPRLLPTDFCTSREAFQTAVQAAAPEAIVFVDAPEWREILVTLSECAREVDDAPIVILSSTPGMPAPGDFHERVRFVHDDGLAALSAALLGAGSPRDRASLPLDYAVAGGASVLRRAMGASLFGDLGTIGLLAGRPTARDTSAAAAIARLEGPVAGGGFELSAAAALAPLAMVGSGLRAVEWWDRSWPDARDDLLAAARDRGVAQSVRMAAAAAAPARLRRLRDIGVTRIVLTCDVLDERPDLRLPGAADDSRQIARAVVAARAEGIEAGVLLVIGIPGEGAAAFARRSEILREARPERIRAVPFEPAGGTAAYDRCAERGLWPPEDNRWNRELYQPLRQAEAADYPEVLEGALMLVAETSR